MDPAPFPPHERPWRHPSELAAAEREAFRAADVPSGTRVFAMVTGTVGLLAIGMMVLSFTPDRTNAPVAVGATTNPIATAAVELRQATVAVMGRFASGAANETLPAAVRPSMATPIGDGRRALMTQHGVDTELGEAFDVRLSSGQIVTASVMETTDDGVVVVTIATTSDGHDVALDLPEPDEIVTILADPPITVPFADVATVSAAEGTPVVDRLGALIGLCTDGLNVQGSPDGLVGVIGITTAGDHPPEAVSREPALATTVGP